VNDRDLYGQGLVTTFERRWRLLGAAITSSRSVAGDEPRLPVVAAAIARERPQVVYFGGQGTAAIQLAGGLREAGDDGPIMGGDAITSTDFIRTVRGADRPRRRGRPPAGGPGARRDAGLQGDHRLLRVRRVRRHHPPDAHREPVSGGQWKPILSGSIAS
jgi:hypothetical protein